MRTKIVATIGPSTSERDKVHALAELGVDVIRVNFAHASHEEAGRIIEWVREASAMCHRPIAVLADLAGPKIRVGDLPANLRLEPRETVVLAPEGVATGDELPVTYAGLAADTKPGDRVLLDDGLLELVIRSIEGQRVTCVVERGGLLRSHKGINLPGIEVSAPSLTPKDLADLECALANDIDYVGLSFVQRASDVTDLKRRIDGRALVVAKIEKDKALEDLEAVLSATDAVMVARGDLGVELPFEDVPVAQKRIIQLANLYGRPVITATQMLDSMMHNPRPTRAEVSDVANAVFDGTDAVMLSGETAAGAYPLLALEAMGRIVGATEKTPAYADGPKYDVPLSSRLHVGFTPTEHAIAAATVEAVRRLGAPAIVTFTRTGSTTRLVSSYRPGVPIIAVSDDLRTWRQLALVWGVHPVRLEAEVSYEAMLAAARDYLLAARIAERGQRFIVTAGVPFHVAGTTNMLRVEEL